MSDVPRPAKLLLDENLSPWVAQQLRDEGVDAVHVNERNLSGATDTQVFARAYQEDRVLVTSNVADFEKLCRSIEAHAGVVLLEEGDLLRNEQLSILREAVQLVAAEQDMVNRVLKISANGTHEFRELP